MILDLQICGGKIMTPLDRAENTVTESQGGGTADDLGYKKLWGIENGAIIESQKYCHGVPGYRGRLPPHSVA